MTRVGIISNPRSRENLSGMQAVRDLLRARPEIPHIELGHIAELPAAVRALAAAKVELLAVNGGDGTVIATLTSLLDDGPFGELPLLSIIPAGMTNLIARDVGIRGSGAPVLRRLLAAAQAGNGKRVRRAVLTVTGAKPTPVHGMLLGTGAFYRATMLSRQKVHPTGVKRSLAVAASIGLAAVKTLWPERGPDRFYRGDAMSFDAGNGGDPGGPYFLTLVTTLHRLSLRLHPFWGYDSRPIRYVTVAFPPRRFARALLPLLRGRPLPWMPAAGYSSGSTDRIAMRLESPIVLDGEIIQPQPSVPIEVTAEHSVTLLRV